MSADLPPYRTFSGGPIRKTIKVVALVVFCYATWHLIAKKDATRIEAVLFFVSTAVLFALSMADYRRWWREVKLSRADTRKPNEAPGPTATNGSDSP